MSSPVTFLKRHGIVVHVPADADKHQLAASRSHEEPVASSVAHEVAQSAWPSPLPDEKGFEDATTPV